MATKTITGCVKKTRAALVESGDKALLATFDEDSAIMLAAFNAAVDSGTKVADAARAAVDAQIAEVEKVIADMGDVPADPAAAAQAAEQGGEAPAKAPTKIADFGEKLEGARKDYATALKDAESVDIASEPLSKSWPEPDYDKLLAGGADPFAVAFVHAARDEVPTKPQKSWKLKGWVQSVELLRGVSQKLLAGQITPAQVRMKLNEPEFKYVRQYVGSRAELYELVGHKASLNGVSFAQNRYGLYKGEQNVTKWVVEQKAKATAFSNWPRELAVADTKAAMLDQFQAKFMADQLGDDGKAKAPNKGQFSIYRKRGEPGAFIGKKIGREYIDLKKVDDVKQAREFLENNTADLEAALAKYKETPFERNAENQPRVGDDHRNGAPVTPEVFAETFGFRGVQFGNYVEQGRRQSDLNQAYDALMDMAAVLGIPPRAISLNGRLGLAFGARGKGGKNAPAAHYEPDTVVINLTKGSGPGSLAHEWWHGLDNYFARENGGSGYVTDGARAPGMREQMQAAFNSVKTATQMPTLRRRAAELDKRKSKPYWNTPLELSARAFESYIIAKLRDQSAANDYLANVVDEQVWNISEAARAAFFGGDSKAETYPYPLQAELPPVRAAFDEFFKTVETRTDDAGNVALFSRTPTPDTPAPALIADAERVAFAIRDSWATKPPTVVIFGMQDAKVPQRVREADAEQRSQGAEGEPEGFYYRGTIYVNANVVQRPADVMRVMYHEGLGHAGLRGHFGPELDRMLLGMSRLYNQDTLRAKATQYGQPFTLDEARAMVLEDQPDLRGAALESAAAARLDRGRRVTAEEVLAELAQNRPSSTWVTKAVRLIREFVRDTLGFKNLKLSDSEIIETFLAPARGFIERGRAAERGDAVPAFARRFSSLKGSRPTASYVDATPRQQATLDAIDEGPDSTGYDLLPAKEDINRAADAAFTDWEQERGIKYVSIDMLGPLTGYDNTKDAARIRRLADSIKVSNEFEPIFVGIDPSGEAFIMEGQHRTRALQLLGDTHVPAQVIVDMTGSDADYDAAPDEPRVIPTDYKAVPGQGVLFSRPSSTPKKEQRFALSDSGRFDDFVYKFQDKQIDLKRAIGAIKAEKREIEDRWDAYLQEELFHGRAAKRTQDFVAKELEPLLTDMALKMVKLPELEQYLHARHAKEANELIAERNKLPNDGQMDTDGNVIVSPLQDGGSGMLTADAEAYLKGLDPAVKKRLEALAQRVDAMIAKTRQTYVDYGLESQATVDGWAEMFDFYVPLMREDKDGGMGIGQGFSIKGRETKGRTGSTAAVVDILANIAMQRERAIVRGEKNRVAVALAGLVKTNPNPDLWQFDVVPTERVLNPDTNLVEERPNFNFKNQPNVVVAKIVDSKGNVVERAVVFNEQNERGMRMAAALKNLDVAQLEGVMGAMAKATRYFAAINTQWNPIFGTVNLARDVQGAALNLGSTPIANKRAAVVAGIPSALRTIYRTERGKSTKNADMAALWEDLQREGGMTGFRDQFRTSEERADAIRFAMDPTNWTESKWGRVFTAGGLLKVPLTTAQKLATPLFTWLTDYNQAMEGATRLAAYKVALEQGLSKQRAASIAKNMTVNFNRKGQVGMQAGALYAFFNASVQGTARMGEVLIDTKGGQGFGLKPAARYIIGGGILLGAIQAMLLAAMGFDDDEPPEFVRERNLIIPTGWATGQKDYIQIPMPLGWHVFPNIGRIATEYVLDGFTDTGKRLAKLGVIFAESFNPIGSTTSLLQFISPTVTDPIVALAENKDWTGKPIARESFDRTTPGFQLARDTASDPSKWIAEGLNFMSGGTRHTRGALSPTPDQIDYLFGQVTGGVGRELVKINQTVTSQFTGEELPPHKIPLAGRFYGNAESGNAQGGRFYENMNRMAEHKAMLEGLREDIRKAGSPEEAARLTAERDRYRAENPETELVTRATIVERRVRQLRREKREALKTDAPKAQVKAIEDRITERMRDLNEAIKAKEKPKPLREAIRLTPAPSTPAREVQPA
jgi:hypothetical protein